MLWVVTGDNGPGWAARGEAAQRAINGAVPFVPTLVASAALVTAHWFLSVLAVRPDRVGTWVKGQPRTLVRVGEETGMRWQRAT